MDQPWLAHTRCQSARVGLGCWVHLTHLRLGARVSSSCRRKVTTDSAESTGPVAGKGRARAPPAPASHPSRPTPPSPVRQSTCHAAPPPMKAALRLPLPFLSGQVAGINAILCAVDFQPGQRQRQHRFPFELPRLWRPGLPAGSGSRGHGNGIASTTGSAKTR